MQVMQDLLPYVLTWVTPQFFLLGNHIPQGNSVFYVTSIGPSPLIFCSDPYEMPSQRLVPQFFVYTKFLTDVKQKC